MRHTVKTGSSPSLRTIGEELGGVTWQTAIAHVRALTAKGYVSVGPSGVKALRFPDGRPCRLSYSGTSTRADRDAAFVVALAAWVAAWHEANP